MSGKTHTYHSQLVWMGNLGEGTSNYKAYSREYKIKIDGKPEILGSSDPNFRGDSACHNPEDMLLMSLSSCHMLWYLHLCSVNNIVVESYVDHATAIMLMNDDGSGQFESASLEPQVTISSGDEQLAEKLHHKASSMCFIARSVNFSVTHKPQITLRN